MLKHIESIGERPERTEITVDGAYYEMIARMEGISSEFGISGDGPLYEAVHSLMLAVRECSRELEPVQRRVEF